MDGKENFGKPGYYSRNNTAYWFGKPYLGIGPSAHSFDGRNRQWNVSNNALYIKAIKKGEIPSRQEALSPKDRYNELVMTRLRTQWGINPAEVRNEMGQEFYLYLIREATPLLEQGKLIWTDGNLKISPEAKFFSDGIAAELFFIEN